MTITTDKAPAAAPHVDKAKFDSHQAGVRPAMAQAKRPALGRGLESLLPGPRTPGSAGAAPAAPSNARGTPESHQVTGTTDPAANAPVAASTGPGYAAQPAAARAPNDGAAVPATV